MPVANYLFALIIGLGFVAWMFPVGRLFPLHPLDVAMSGDAAQHAIGQRYFINDAWRWPLFDIPRLNAPEGANVALTDSIPLVAVLLKLLRAWLPAGFTVTESWVAIAFILQPVAAVFALRSAGERRFVPAAAISVIALSMPTLLMRFVGTHEALCSHFLILFAIGLYFRQTAPGRGRRAPGRIAVPALILASLLIHPYLLAMVTIMLAAAPLTLIMRRDRRWRGAAVCFVLSCLVTAIVALVLGYGGSEPAPGFGIYSMNLLGPVQSHFSTLLPFDWRDPTGGQGYEGFQYLGLGVLVLAVAALAVSVMRSAGRTAIYAHGGLVLVCLALFAFALSSRVYLGGHLLFGLKTVPLFIQQFRASGRFFWPVAYVIVIASIAALASRLRTPWLAALLAVCGALQVADTALPRNGGWRAEHQTEAWVIPRAALLPAFAAASRLSLWPLQNCAINSAGEPAYMQTLLLASTVNLTTNTMYMSRFQADNSCDSALVLAAPWQPGELRVIAPPAPPVLRWLVPHGDTDCRQAGPLVACAEPAGMLAGLPLPTPFSLPRGVTLHPADRQLAEAMASGWSGVEPSGRWSLGTVARVMWDLPPAEPPPASVTIQAMGLAPQPGGVQQVEIAANGQVLTVWDLPDQKDATLHINLPSDLTGHLDLTFRVLTPVRPAARGMGQDTRALGMLLKTFRLD
jgi:hypothetical protein